MRTALLAGLVFCLLFGWVGRGLFYARHEDAAIEALLQSGATVVLVDDLPTYTQRGVMANQGDISLARRLTDQLLRAIGWRRRPEIDAVALEASDPQDPAVANALAALGRLPEIDWVALNGPGFDDSSVGALGNLPRLKHLTLEGTSITSEGLASLRSPERLETLEVGCHLTQSGLLSGVVAMTKLRSLRVHDEQVVQSEIEAVASLPNLQSLDLMAALAHGESKFAPLAGHPSLGALHLRSASFDEEEIEALAGMLNLQTLWIEGVDDEELLKLAKSRSIRTLGVAPPATREAVGRLSAERPDWTVVFFGHFPTETFTAGVSDAASQPPAK